MSDSTVLTPRKKRAARTRQAILDAARELITERGAYNLSLRAIARQIEYSPAGLYEYFSSKDDIIAAVVEDGFARFANDLFSVPQTLPPSEYLHELGLAYVRFAVQNPQHFMLIFNTISIHGEGERGVYISEGTFQALTSGLQRAQNAGEIHASHDLRLLSYSAWSLVHGMATLQLTQLRSEDADWEAATQKALHLWFGSLQLPADD